MRISQREARRLRKRVHELETHFDAQRRNWGQEYVGGVEIARSQWEATATVPTSIRTARKLDHAVVWVGDDGGLIRFIALPLAERAK